MNNIDINELAKELAQQYAKKELVSGYHIEALYPYYDTDVNLIYVRLRLKNPISKEKWIRAFHLDKNLNKWRPKEPKINGKKPLYNLLDIINSEDETIWIFEGETCVEAAKELGLLSITSGSSTSANNTDWASLKKRQIIIWPDNDSSGRSYASEVTEILLSLDCEVKWVNTDSLNLEKGGDIIDWLHNNKTATKDDVLALELKSPEVLQYKPKIKNDGFHNINSINAATVEIKPIKWLWQKYFACGKISMLVGDPGLGKSQLTAYLAAITTNGGVWPDGSHCNSVGGVVILSAEDDINCTIVPRLIAAGANRDKIDIIQSINNFKELEQLLEIKPEIALIIIDPISAYLGSINSHNNSEVRSALMPLAQLAAKYHFAIICVSHLNKGTTGNALARVSGSIAFTAAARATFLVTKHQSDPTKRLFLQLKNNIADCQNGLAFTIEPCEVDNNIKTSRVKWLYEQITMSADEILSELATSLDAKKAIDEAKEFLIELLRSNSLFCKIIQEEAKNAGQAWRTVERAKRALHIRSKRAANGWIWHLP